MDVSSSVHIKNSQNFYTRIILSEVTAISSFVSFFCKKKKHLGQGMVQTFNYSLRGQRWQLHGRAFSKFSDRFEFEGDC